MRKHLIVLAAFAALAGVAPVANAQFAGSTMTVAGGGAGGNNTGSFFGGFTPTNIVNKPINVSGAAMPNNNFQQAMMPQKQSTNVFNINSAIRNVQMPVFKSVAPSMPVVQPGPSNPIQPVALPKQRQTPPAQQNILKGLLPWI